MADLTSAIQKPGLSGVAPTYSTVSASDVFTALPNTRYMLHYKNGATTTGGSLPFKVTDPTTPTPSGSSPGAGFADSVSAATGMLGSTELVVYIDNSTRFMNSSKQITLTHGGTLTTVTVAIFQLA
jgi:hypothetical protein